MASVYTNKGEEILIDDEDFDFVNQFTWCIETNGYPGAYVPGSGHKGKRVCLHTLLRHAPAGFDVAHVNENKRDARQKNLQAITHRKNNQKHEKTPGTGIRKRGNSFQARLGIWVDGRIKEHCLGTYKTFDHALLARIIGEIRYWGEPTQQMP